jgi:indolepyruvate decarboxylase
MGTRRGTLLFVFGNLFDLPANAFVAQTAWGSLGHDCGSALGIVPAAASPLLIAGDGVLVMQFQEIPSFV